MWHRRCVEPDADKAVGPEPCCVVVVGFTVSTS